MTGKSAKVGSIWRRWDLHIHAPGTKISNAYDDPPDDNLKTYLEILEASDVQVFGITDYFSFDGYLEVVERYKDLYPDGNKFFIPNIEFRLTQTISSDGQSVHTHVLVDPKVATKEKLSTFLMGVPTHITRNGAHVKCSELRTTSDYQQATVSITDIEKALRDVFPDATTYLIVTAGSNDGLRGVATRSRRSISISNELDKASHAFFGSSKNTEYFLKTARYEGPLESLPKPVFSGSDAHSFSDLSRLSGDEPDYEPTWIKADTTFRGLRQTLFEPKGRVHIGEKPTVLVRQDREATRFISELRIDQVPSYSGENGSWFKDVVIPFNPELTAIIGNKGSGKSAIADILGLLGESRQHEHFSFLTDAPNNRKFRQKGYAENFKGELEWKSGIKCKKLLSSEIDELKPEAVKYLPQNYFESLTNEIEVKAFRKEIEGVVFSHVDEADRMGKSNFKELEDIKTTQSKSEISELKARLREFNMQIVELERQADPKHKARLTEELKARREEYRVLERSKPKEEPRPDSATSEQTKVAELISKKVELRDNITARGNEGVERLTELKSDLQKLSSIKEAVLGIGSRVNVDKTEIKQACEELGLDIEQIIKHQTDLSSVDAKIGEVSAEIKRRDTDNELEFSETTNFDDLVSVPDLRKAHTYISDQIKGLQDTLTAPQKRYQRYLQASSEINAKLSELHGSDKNAKPGTIKDLKRRISHIDNDLSLQIDKKYEDRDKLSRSIFACKKRVRSFYESLKTSVELRLASVSSDEFQVTIDASFVPAHEFSDEFIQQINQNVIGPFRGISEGRSQLDKRIADVDWNNVENILAFVKSVISSIKDDDIGKQVKDIKRFYDQLFSFEYFDAKYELRLGGKNLNQLSPGEKGLLLLVFYLHLDKEKTPLIIDQPEDNLDNDSIFSVLAKCIREAKKNRQVILVTHNPNLAIGADAEQILYVKLDKAAEYEFSYQTGSIENPKINAAIVRILEGSKPAFVQRRLVYQIP